MFEETTPGSELSGFTAKEGLIGEKSTPLILRETDALLARLGFTIAINVELADIHLRAPPDRKIPAATAFNRDQGRQTATPDKMHRIN